MCARSWPPFLKETSHLLQARFFEDRDNDEVCGDFGVDRDYLRVLIHRAIHKFGELYKKRTINNGPITTVFRKEDNEHKNNKPR